MPVGLQTSLRTIPSHYRRKHREIIFQRIRHIKANNQQSILDISRLFHSESTKFGNTCKFRNLQTYISTQYLHPANEHLHTSFVEGAKLPPTPPLQENLISVRRFWTKSTEVGRQMRHSHSTFPPERKRPATNESCLDRFNKPRRIIQRKNSEFICAGSRPVCAFFCRTFTTWTRRSWLKVSGLLRSLSRWSSS